MRLTPTDVRTAISAAELDLVTAARSGNPQAREAIFRRHVQLVSGLAFRLCGRFADANAITAESFRAAFAAGWDLPAPEALRLWLVCSVTRLVNRTISKAHLRARLRLRTATASVFTTALETMPPLEADDLRRFYARVDRLPLRMRALLILHRLERLSAPEIALALEMPIGAVRRTIQRADRQADQTGGQRAAALASATRIAMTSSRFT